MKPKAGGGRTTSVSIMTREGIKKMYDNTLLVIDDERYINFKQLQQVRKALDYYSLDLFYF